MKRLFGKSKVELAEESAGGSYIELAEAPTNVPEGAAYIHSFDSAGPIVSEDFSQKVITAMHNRAADRLKE